MQRPLVTPWRFYHLKWPSHPPFSVWIFLLLICQHYFCDQKILLEFSGWTEISISVTVPYKIIYVFWTHTSARCATTCCRFCHFEVSHQASLFSLTNERIHLSFLYVKRTRLNDTQRAVFDLIFLNVSTTRSSSILKPCVACFFKDVMLGSDGQFSVGSKFNFCCVKSSSGKFREENCTLIPQCHSIVIRLKQVCAAVEIFKLLEKLLRLWTKISVIEKQKKKSKLLLWFKTPNSWFSWSKDFAKVACQENNC